jgi:hypothetical protein
MVFAQLPPHICPLLPLQGMLHVPGTVYLLTSLPPKH